MAVLKKRLAGADLCLILTEWDEVKNFEVKKFEKLMKCPIILDGRNCYRLEQFENTRITYDSIGRKTVNADLYTEK